ncbi:FAD-dependent monooxygenase [Bradyrhizobium sp. Arg237L]|uniref:FAD-dependent monooxygenase n=1 Tax=Bradyrhizobium sp. Arg237L TaxID=3003352 RepID=UPI00249F7B46|nr:FAD-dependent monooxygenase [Bradyrhizobium sp. Arg237L]MDI4234118.1 FAD-dependent monooxygenase [Bradyrhizobium sp. Arg237L]
MHDKISGAMIFNREQRIHLNGTDILLEYSSEGGAIERLDLLKILRAACSDVGVDIRHNCKIEALDQFNSYDLIVGADGVNSLVRRLNEEAFGTEAYTLTNHFAWYGVGRAMQPGSLIFRTAAGGRFVGHYYPYTPRMSTFVAECDAATWRSVGLAGMSDDERRKFMETVFAPELMGDPLIDNRSIWRNFPVVTNKVWSVGNIVLIGDALMSAHFSIGSGTRLAMDDAAALFEAIQQTDDVAAALVRFDGIRRPWREQFGEAAKRSFSWYERLEEIMGQELIDFAYDFLTRTGRVDDVRLAQYTPEFFRMYKKAKGAGLRP